MRSPKIYGYGVGVICAVIAATHAPGLKHHLHWKATIIWGVIAVLAAAFSSVFFADTT